MKEQTIDTKTAIMHPTKGTTTIAPEVLLTIAQLTTLNVPGVSRMSNAPGGVNRLFKRGRAEGVRIDIRDDVVYIDLYLILKKDVNIRDVSRQVQHEVARARFPKWSACRSVGSIFISKISTISGGR